MNREPLLAATAPACIYERPGLRDLAGETLRPGGLALTDQAIALCALPPGAKVLDVGCGRGTTVQHLRTVYHLAALGLDVSTALLRSHSPEDPIPPLLQAAGERLPVASRELDAIIAECSLSAMADADAALGEFERVLKPGGVLIVSDVYARNAERLWAGPPLPPDTCLSGARSQAQITDRLQTHGFQITLWQDHSALLKQLAVQLIMTHGSLPQFWQQTASADAAPEMKRVTAKIKPGYYLLLARKGEA